MPRIGSAQTELTGRTIAALFWMVLDNGGSQALSFVVYAILARLLRPEAFGIFSLALAIIAVTAIPLQGIGSALVQSNSLTEDDLSTAFWANLLLGLLLAAAMYGAAGWLAAGFHTPLLRAALRDMVAIYPFRALSSIPLALCQRELRMSVFAVRTAAGSVVAGTVAIALAMLGWSFAALVVFQVLQTAVAMLALWWSISWRPRLRFSRTTLRQFAGFSSHVVGAQLLLTVAERASSIAIGLFLNVTVLGYYDLALKLMVGVAMLVLAPFQTVGMSVLSRMAPDQSAFSASLIRLMTASAAIWTPAACCLAITAPLLVPLAFGAHWDGTVPVLQAMCLGCAILPIGGLAGTALTALGEYGLYFWVAAAQLGIAVVSFGVAAQFGIVTTGCAWVLAAALALPLQLALLRQKCGLKLSALMTRIGCIAASGLMMTAVAVAVIHAAGPGPWSLGLALLTGSAAYLASLEYLALPGYVSGILRTIWRTLPRRAAA